MLPPGSHFLGYSAVSKFGEVSPITWFFAHLGVGEVVVRRWDSDSELLVPFNDRDEVRLRVRSPCLRQLFFVPASLGEAAKPCV